MSAILMTYEGDGELYHLYLLSHSNIYNSIEKLHVFQLLPELTRWKYYQSIKHGDSVGVGMPVQTVNKNREKINDGVLEHFLDFITSTHILLILHLDREN